MASQAQIDANRRNALLSTGPKTGEGKAAVSQNALKHGLRSDVYKEPMKDPEIYDELLADLIAEHQPQTLTEEFYVERMALCLDKLSFLEGLQNEAMFTEQDRNIYWNQQDRLERGFDRALATLRKLQKERRASEPAPSPAEKPDPQLAPQAERTPGPAQIGFVRQNSISGPVLVGQALSPATARQGRELSRLICFSS